MNTSLLISTIAICLIPLIASYIVMLMMVTGFCWWKGIIACLCGMFAVALVAILQVFVDFSSMLNLNTLIGILLGTLLVNGLVEEGFKALVLFALPGKKHPEREFFSYGILSGLTFACFETILYFFVGSETVTLRFVSAVIIHASCAGLGSLTVYGFKTRKPYFFPLILAILLHGLYDYFALMPGFLGWVKYAVVFVSLIECGVRYSKLKEMEKSK